MTGEPVLIKPARIRLEASTICQLRCVSCPTASGEISRDIGAGFLKFIDLKELIDRNPWINSIDLSNWGEIFLNPELKDIMKYAYEKNVRLHADMGVNLNTITDDQVEALVKYRFRSMTCALDGADNESYRIYRRRGNFDRVIANIKKINDEKEKYVSQYPRLLWQFIAFGHNEHMIGKAREMAKSLGMNFYVKLSFSDFSPVKNKRLVQMESGLGVADRREYFLKYGICYARGICTQLWDYPKINFDGSVLGCCTNTWGNYGNAFRDGLVEGLNNEKINYARSMLQGKSPQRNDIPCIRCDIYKVMKKTGRWLSEAEITAGNNVPIIGKGSIPPSEAGIEKVRPAPLITRLANRLFSH